MTGLFFGAQDWTRTSTGILPLPPQSSVSTNFTTWAYMESAKIRALSFVASNAFFFYSSASEADSLRSSTASLCLAAMSKDRLI